MTTRGSFNPKGSRRTDAGEPMTVARIDAALRTLARIMRDHGDRFDNGDLMKMAQNLYDERNRISQPDSIENLMADLMKVA
ncbi:hypothetical protein [Thalassospira sp.]|uniref:hypothetical protein n=1 Tax=Thalassospira sp. TaxID=1912094 RepID=UPI003AA8D314